MLSLDNATDLFLRAVFELSEREGMGLEVLPKSSSRLMRILNRFIRLFNPRWMEGFNVTFGSTVYMTDEQPERQMVSVLLHELTHIYDRKKHGLRFTVGYAMPQLLGLLALPLLVLPALLVLIAPSRVTAWIGAVVGFVASIVGWALWSPWVLLTAVFLLALAPWPSPWRVKWERRGYKMTIAAHYWMYGGSLSTTESLARYFTGFDYYRMSWSESQIVEMLAEDREAIEEGEVEKDPWFARAHVAIIEAKRNVA